MRSFMQKFWQDESGQDLIEYTLLMAFVALASASIFHQRWKQHQHGSGDRPALSCPTRQQRQPVSRVRGVQNNLAPRSIPENPDKHK